ncbi:enolase C-terminal domain-like protein [Bosea sp. BK604]|uniref:enolase C-terminal domain-like protein n=1 Tax=Bosea sp. BK604 TaxID=2512180 RepID=UPI00104E3426|nr:enolase C-terminal domain-like protein [Bosea sp. BK604]TCR63085.1 L-alanine-DL-glutamate epimerase-like enolase superfamily enzyme [Bosea sp. BK604]
MLNQEATRHVARDIPQGEATRIRRIEIIRFKQEMENVAFDVSPSGIDMPGVRTTRKRIAVRIETRDGAVGEYVGGRTDTAPQTEFIAKRIIGRDCFAREAVYEDTRRWLRKEDRIGGCQIDNALWDLAGKRTGHSVSDMLGGQRGKRLPAYASTWFGGDGGGLATPEAFADFAEECHGIGYRAFKMHGWTDGGWRRDAAAIRLLGRRVGGRMKLMHDSACHLKTFADALACGRACDEAGFFWYEDPYSDGGLAAHAHRRLRELIKTPILLGEHIRGVEAMATLTLADGTDFVRADPDLDIGITGTMKIAHFAEALGLDCELHGNGPAHRHAMAALRNTNFYEIAMVGPSRGQPVGTYYTDGYSDKLDAVAPDGCFVVPVGPGLGVSYDWDFIEKNKLSHSVFE